MEKEIQAWVTKYALTDGIKCIVGEISDCAPNMISEIKSGTWLSSCFHGKDWHKTEAEAIARAEQMRVEKIASLKKQIAKLEAMKFEPKG